MLQGRCAKQKIGVKMNEEYTTYYFVKPSSILNLRIGQSMIFRSLSEVEWKKKLDENGKDNWKPCNKSHPFFPSGNGGFLHHTFEPGDLINDGIYIKYMINLIGIGEVIYFVERDDQIFPMIID